MGLAWFAIILVSGIAIAEAWVIAALLNRLLAQAKLAPLSAPKFVKDEDEPKAEPARRKISTIMVNS